MTARPHLKVYSRDGVVEIPLTGDPNYDALLERIARRGGTVLRDGVLTEEEPSEADTRAALQDGA